MTQIEEHIYNSWTEIDNALFLAKEDDRTDDIEHVDMPYSELRDKIQDAMQVAYEIGKDEGFQDGHDAGYDACLDEYGEGPSS